MKKALLSILLGIILLVPAIKALAAEGTISTGSQPQVSADNKGTIRVVYGDKDNIFCATSANQGVSFSKPVLVGRVANMHLGMSRGPQLASSDNYSVITAMDKSGNIHWFRLKHSSSKWETMGVINDINQSAPEGLMGLTADKNNNFYAVWLDIRLGQHNQVYFSKLMAKTTAWSKNILAYQSPDGHVCECCKPNIAVQGREVAIMFRNWLGGSRDLYVTRSADGGNVFQPAQKMGTGTWPLNGCPMDGGGIVINSSNNVQTAWQRKGDIFYAQPGASETLIGKGRNCSIAAAGAKTMISFQNNDTLKVASPNRKEVTMVGKGSFLKTILLNNNTMLCVWEQDNVIKFKKV
ncbi:hypothetical protein PQ469_26185 [Mucilaginibacter sp. KACC 22773]|uniref:hypothetical protein n=1 Tax=Mucilaginibacter sp. KACC 22773 TaxID=3025671 RepID=UPI002365D272|nr:hypothetical protein [Mucilaginibacter sp. KACC 22773]WDF77377.1 hypothetical protein PQ469_26185 [Mucilaginibacter sp. KACC 22773]